MSSTIQELLQQILSATYGEEVRGSIHDAIEECYDDVSTAKTRADDAADRAETAAERASDVPLNFIANEYVADSMYHYLPGLICIHDTSLYRCKEPTSGTWDSTKWEEVVIGTVLADLFRSICSNVFHYNNGTGYAVGDLIEHNSRLYKCRVAISDSGEEWNSQHWDSTSIMDELAAIKSEVTDEVADLKSHIDKVYSRQAYINKGVNLLDMNLSKPAVISGITFTPHFTNGFLDYINVNGTASARADYDVVTGTEIDAGTYIACAYIDGNGQSVSHSGINRTEFYNISIGTDVSVTDAKKSISISTKSNLTVRIRVDSGDSVSNAKVYPMICAESETYKYYPFGFVPTIAQIVDDLETAETNIAEVTANLSYLNAHTALSPDAENVLNYNASETIVSNGITFTPHFTRGFLDYINVNGTASARADFTITSANTIPAGNYKVSSFLDEDGEQASYTNVRTEYYNSSTGFACVVNAANIRTASSSSAGAVTLNIRVTQGNTANNVKVYPMVRLSSSTDTKYIPFGYIETIKEALDETNQRITNISFSADPLYWIFHIDCGRKYISVANLKLLIDQMALAGMNQIQLHLSDDNGFRFALDDMTFTDVDGVEYDLTPCLGGTESATSWYTQTDMDAIISYAEGKGIAVVPSIDMPGHMGRILATFTQFRYSTYTTSLDIANSTAVKFCHAIVDKYTKYFVSRGCQFWNFGFDEFASGQGLDDFYDDGDYDKVTDFADGIIALVKKNGMIPRMYQDALYFQHDYNNFISKDAQINVWTIPYTGAPITGELQRIGYNCINMSAVYYWVLGNPEYQINITPEALDTVNNLLTDFKTQCIKNGIGACLSVWCDRATTVDVGDGGNSIVTAATPLIAAFGRAIQRTIANIE